MAFAQDLEKNVTSHLDSLSAYVRSTKLRRLPVCILIHMMIGRTGSPHGVSFMNLSSEAIVILFHWAELCVNKCMICKCTWIATYLTIGYTWCTLYCDIAIVARSYHIMMRKCFWRPELGLHSWHSTIPGAAWSFTLETLPGLPHMQGCIYKNTHTYKDALVTVVYCACTKSLQSSRTA